MQNAVAVASGGRSTYCGSGATISCTVYLVAPSALGPGPVGVAIKGSGVPTPLLRLALEMGPPVVMVALAGVRSLKWWPSINTAASAGTVSGSLVSKATQHGGSVFVPGSGTAPVTELSMTNRPVWSESMIQCSLK